MTLGGGHVRVGVHLMLEVIHQGAVGDEGQRPGQVAVQVFFRVRAEKALRPGPGHKLHGHGVDLAGLHAGPDVAARDPVPVHPAGEGVARLVGDHLHVPLGAVEVGENEGHLVVHDPGAVAAPGLALGSQHVHQIVVQHGLEKLAGLRGQLVVELFALGDDIVRRALGPGVAGTEFQGVVGVAQGIGHPDALGLRPENPVGQGHQILAHGGPEALHVLLGVAVALHAVVAQGGVALIAQLAAHLVPQVGQLVINAVQLGLVVLVPLAHRLPGSQTAGVVRVALEGPHLGQGVGLTLKGDLGGGDELLMLLGQVVLPLELGHDLRREVLPEGGGQHSRRPRLGVLLQLRPGGVPEVHLPVVELVPGVDGVADAGQGDQCVHMTLRRLLLQEHGPGFLIAFCRLQAAGQVPQLPLYLVQVRTLVGHLGKFHGKSLLFIGWAGLSRSAPPASDALHRSGSPGSAGRAGRPPPAA